MQRAVYPCPVVISKISQLHQARHFSACWLWHQYRTCWGQKRLSTNALRRGLLKAHQGQPKGICTDLYPRIRGTSTESLC